MSLRRLLPILILALMLAPFGRMAAAEAKAMPHHGAMQAAHCAGQPQPADETGHGKMAIDCMIACAAVAVAADPFVIPLAAALGLPEPATTPSDTGIRPEADPPPPRLA